MDLLEDTVDVDGIGLDSCFVGALFDATGVDWVLEDHAVCKVKMTKGFLLGVAEVQKLKVQRFEYLGS